MEDLKSRLKEVLKSKKLVITILCVIILIGGIMVYYLINSESGEDFIFAINGKISESNNINLLSESVSQNNQEDDENEKSGQNQGMVKVDGNIILNKENGEDNRGVNDNISLEGMIAIHITGEVNKTGIIYINEGARIADAIEKAGGVTKNANIDQVNLAYVLEDGQKIYIPSKNEKIEQGAYIISDSGKNVLIEKGKSSSNSQNTNSKGGKGKLNINSANTSELENLPGIGPSLAQRIVEYREQNGKFQKIEDIQNVKGIGDAKYSNIKEYICI